MRSLISVDWLMANCNDPDLVVLDASTASNVSGLTSDNQDSRIVGARWIDLKNTFADKSSTLPNTVLSPEKFEIEAKKLGINSSSKIVVYDNIGIYTSPRAWWLFKLMGHENIGVLDGGLAAWIEAGGKVEETGKVSVHSDGDFVVEYRAELFRSAEDLLKNIETEKELVVDARSNGRFLGVDPEPRPHLDSGHIPKSKSLHFKNVLQGHKMKSKEALADVFRGFDNETIVFTCGSGTTACIIMLAADQISDANLAVFDGSWTEWATRDDCPIN